MIVVFIERFFFFLFFQTRESYNFIFNFSPFGQRSFLPFLSRELFESPAYDNRLWKKLGPSGSELSSCSLLSIGEETSFEQELPFFFFFFIFLPLRHRLGRFTGELFFRFMRHQWYPRGSRENRSINLSRIVESLLGNHAYPFHFFFFFVDETKEKKNDFLNIKTWKPVIVLNRNEKNKKGDCSNLFIYLFFLFSSIGKSSGIVP